jgi:hypothetical protein
VWWRYWKKGEKTVINELVEISNNKKQITINNEKISMIIGNCSLHSLLTAIDNSDLINKKI